MVRTCDTSVALLAARLKLTDSKPFSEIFARLKARQMVENSAPDSLVQRSTVGYCLLAFSLGLEVSSLHPAATASQRLIARAIADSFGWILPALLYNAGRYYICAIYTYTYFYM